MKTTHRPKWIKDYMIYDPFNGLAWYATTLTKAQKIADNIKDDIDRPKGIPSFIYHVQYVEKI